MERERRNRLSLAPAGSRGVLQHKGILGDSRAEDQAKAAVPRSKGNGIINSFPAKRLRVYALTGNKIGAELFACTRAAPI